MVLADTPVGRDRRERILNAAMATFMELGYCGSSMDEITRRAGVSKATVYTHFASKEELFIQVVERACRRNFVDTSPRTGVTLADSLLEIATRYIEFLMLPQSIAIYRMVVAETPRFPVVGRLFYESGPARVQGIVAKLLEGAAERGEVAVLDPLGAAERFIGAAIGLTHLQAGLGITHSPPPETLKANVNRFLRSYGS